MDASCLVAALRYDALVETARSLYKGSGYFNQVFMIIAALMNKIYSPDKTMEIIKDKLSAPVVLVGMMGSGKSHTGRMLADRLGLDFYDSDSLIEERAGCKVSEIFERFGEEKFRESEKDVISGLLDQPSCIIATGGGAVMNEETLQAIKDKAISVWLKPDITLLAERLRDKTDRPLLQGNDLAGTLEELMAARELYYARADITLEIAAGTEKETLARLIKSLSEYLNAARF